MNIEITEQFGEFESLKEIQLDKIVEVSFNELILKQNFELLIKVLESHRAYMNRLNERIKQHDSLLKELNGDDELKKSLDERLKQLEEKQEISESKLKETEEKLKVSDENLQSFKTDCGKEIDQLKKQLAGLNGQPSMPSIDLSAIDELKQSVNQFKDNVNQEIEGIKNQLNDLVGKQEQFSQQQEKFEDAQQQLESKQEKLDKQLKNVQKEIIDIQLEIEELKNHNLEVIPIVNNQDNNENSNNNINRELINQIKQLQVSLNKAKNNIQELASSVNEIEEKMSEKSDKPEVAKLSEAINALKKQLNQIGSEFLKKEVFETYKTVEIPEQFSQLRNQIEDAKGELEQQKCQILQLYDLLSKINQSDKSQPIKIPQLEQPVVVQNVDNGKLKGLESKLKLLESKLLELQQQLSEKQSKSAAREAWEDLQQLLGEKLNRDEFNLAPLEEVLRNVQENFEKAKRQIKKNSNDIISLSERISNQKPVIREKIIERQQQQEQPVVQQKAIDEGELKAFFLNEIHFVQENLLKMIKELQKKMEQKADRSELQAVDEELRELINSLLNEHKKFVTKSELRKAIQQLEAKIRELQTMLLGEKEKSLDGLFVKRPLAWSCASCDHNLDKFKGRLGESVNWAVFPPKETSPLRMGKYAMHYASEVAQKKLEIVESSMNSQKTMGKSDQNFFPNNNNRQQQQQGSSQTMNQTMSQFNQQSSTGLKVVSKTTMPVVKRNFSTRNCEAKKTHDDL